MLAEMAMESMQPCVGEPKFKTYKLTRTQYYSESGMTKAQKQSDKWNKGIQDEMLALQFLNKLGDPKDVVLAFGAGKFAPTGNEGIQGMLLPLSIHQCG